MSEAQFARLERELGRGLMTHGYEDQRWTLAWINPLVGRLFHVSYTIQGVRKLLVRAGWSCQVPVRGAAGCCGGGNLGEGDVVAGGNTAGPSAR
ncbi:winged helix-turn-helix domain-containing protein [Streptomyces sp. NPDC058394]|uniref:helix-turn-helix domain-containing protein n=1 Tax=Streptomyces sp. NPDC058394 TaxID=3346477 RepID=UPI00364D90ED